MDFPFLSLSFSIFLPVFRFFFLFVLEAGIGHRSLCPPTCMLITNPSSPIPPIHRRTAHRTLLSLLPHIRAYPISPRSDAVPPPTRLAVRPDILRRRANGHEQAPRRSLDQVESHLRAFPAAIYLSSQCHSPLPPLLLLASVTLTCDVDHADTVSIRQTTLAVVDARALRRAHRRLDPARPHEAAAGRAPAVEHRGGERGAGLRRLRARRPAVQRDVRRVQASRDRPQVRPSRHHSIQPPLC